MKKGYVLMTISLCILCCVGWSFCAAFAAPYDQAVFDAQKRLTELGYNPGPVDGMMGQKTETAIKNFQKDQGLAITGKLDEGTKQALSQDNIEKSQVTEPAQVEKPVSEPQQGTGNSLRADNAYNVAIFDTGVDIPRHEAPKVGLEGAVHGSLVLSFVDRRKCPKPELDKLLEKTDTSKSSTERHNIAVAECRKSAVYDGLENQLKKAGLNVQYVPLEKGQSLQDVDKNHDYDVRIVIGTSMAGKERYSTWDPIVITLRPFYTVSLSSSQKEQQFAYDSLPYDLEKLDSDPVVADLLAKEKETIPKIIQWINENME